MNIFVGNLSFEAREGDVYRLFMSFGSVAYVSIVMDKRGRESRGFAFLEMPDQLQAEAAIAALHRKEFMGRPINVELARRPRPEVNRDSGKKESGSGGYRSGRRTRSFLIKRARAGIREEAMPHKKNKKNPMAWPKKHSRPKPWQKNRQERKDIEGEAKPRKKSPGTAEPRLKGEGRGKFGGYKKKRRRS